MQGVALPVRHLLRCLQVTVLAGEKKLIDSQLTIQQGRDFCESEVLDQKVNGYSECLKLHYSDLSEARTNILGKLDSILQREV